MSTNFVLPLNHKETLPPIIWIFTEGEGIKSRLPFKTFSTLTTVSTHSWSGRRRSIGTIHFEHCWMVRWRSSRSSRVKAKRRIKIKLLMFFLVLFLCMFHAASLKIKFIFTTVWPRPIWIKVNSSWLYDHSIQVHMYPRGPESASIETPPFRPKNTSKCEHCETRFIS